MTIEQILQLLHELRASRFWGSIAFDYQDGQPVLLRKTETLKTIKLGTDATTKSFGTRNNNHGNTSSNSY